LCTAYATENAAILKKTFDEMGYTTYGGTDAPYVWVSFDGRDSWWGGCTSWKCAEELMKLMDSPSIGPDSPSRESGRCR
jgi:hypothetical protein